MRRKPELMQLEMGMSTRRYFPASGTAGLARSLVRGNSRVPWPPPIMTESTLLVLIDCRPVSDIQHFSSCNGSPTAGVADRLLLLSRTPLAELYPLQTESHAV